MAFCKNKKGFTLVELLVSMTIFVSFVGVLINSYADIVRIQREANEYRVMYVEARKVFERLTDEFRDAIVDYSIYPAGLVNGFRELEFVKKDDLSRMRVGFRDGNIEIANVAINTKDVTVTEFKMYVSPSFNPYASENFAFNAVQFQPKITIYAAFERETNAGRTFEMDLQTTVSSRVYNEINVNVE